MLQGTWYNRRTCKYYYIGLFCAPQWG